MSSAVENQEAVGQAAIPPVYCGVAVASETEGVDRVRALHEDGLSLQAYHLAKQLGLPGTAMVTSDWVLAGRMAMQLGGNQLAAAIHLRAWRADPTHPEACYFRAYGVLSRRGPFAAWEFLKRMGELEGASDIIRSDVSALRAVVLGHLRDFDAAEVWLALAQSQAPDRPWLLVERASLFLLEDRHAEALAAAHEALALKPWYRPAVQITSHLLNLAGRHGEAMELLIEATQRLESSPVLAQLGVLQAEQGRHAEALQTWDRFAEASPLLDTQGRRWLAGRRSDASYELGAIDQAAAFARECGEPFYRALAERLESAAVNSSRVFLLDVGFVQQHHETCAPATLAAVARFWNQPADHLEIADTICYDGTPDHRQRSWAEENGFLTREFTLSEQAAVALLERGVPFTLTTVATESAHLQAVIGQDARRGTLRTRDPSLPYSRELLFEPFLQSSRSHGPKCMVLIPRGEAGRIADLDLPDAALYDQLHALQVALREHDRDHAALAHQALRAAASGHRLELQAQIALAQYDANDAGILAALEELLKLFPDDVNYRIGQLNALRELGRREDRLAVFAERCQNPCADPVLQRRYAQELLADAREHPKAARLIRRALRHRPTDAISFWVLGVIAWDAGRLEEAVEFYRIAACLDDKNEGLAQAYLAAARYFHQTEAALDFLKGRYRRFISRSGLPARTLYSALLQVERRQEAFTVLDEALGLRPEDGDLLLYAAEAHAAHGEFDRAAERLESARGRCRHGDWLRTAANLASAQGDLLRSLSLWRQVLEAEPMAADAHRMVARRLAETAGPGAALTHLAEACDRFPHNHALHVTWIQWLRDQSRAELEPVLRRLLAIHPADAWAHRELALVLSQQRRDDEAFAAMQLASALDPANPREASVRGSILEAAGRLAEARAAYQEAICRSVDNGFSIRRLIETCSSRAERLESFAFIERELERQVTFGDGLAAFADQARGQLDPDELLALFRKAWAVRPDLYQAWSALILELTHQGMLDEAFELAQQAVDRFPLLASAWLDLATVRASRGDSAGECEALDRALELQPGWGTAARKRASACEKQGDYATSCAILERAVAHAPLDPHNHGFLADALWHLDRKDEALDRLVHALRLEPGYEWAWNSLREWSRECQRPELPLSLARQLTQQRAGEARSWLKLAEMLEDSEHLDERLAAIDRAIGLAPHVFEHHDLKARILAQAGRHEEAEAACRAGVWGDSLPVPLRGRAAWIEAVRGNVLTAIARMRTVLADDPDYYWGWRNLVDWSRDWSSPAEYLEAAEAIVRLAPHDAQAAGYRGEARERTGDRQGARQDYQRAIEKDPAYRFAACRLFDLELEDGRLQAAAEALAILQRNHQGPQVVVRELKLAAAHQNRRLASSALKQLCTMTDESGDWPLTAADEAFQKAGWGRHAQAIYAQEIQGEKVHSHVATLWIEHWVKRSPRRLPPGLDQLLARGQLGFRAAQAYLNHLGKTRARRKLQKLLSRHAQILRTSTQCWGSVGYALLCAGQHPAVIQWMSDWDKRSDAEPWMLINLVFALRGQGQDRAANQVSRQAITLAPDRFTPYHILWLVLDDLLDRQPAPARERFNKLDPASFDSANSFLYRLARILLELENARPSPPRDARRKASRDLARLARSLRFDGSAYPAMLLLHRRTVRFLAQDYGKLSGFFLRLAHSIRPPLKRK